MKAKKAFSFSKSEKKSNGTSGLIIIGVLLLIGIISVAIYFIFNIAKDAEKTAKNLSTKINNASKAASNAQNTANSFSTQINDISTKANKADTVASECALDAAESKKLANSLDSKITTVEVTCDKANNFASKAAVDSLNAKETGLQAVSKADLAQDNAEESKRLVDSLGNKITLVETTCDKANNFASQAAIDSLNAKETGLQAFSKADLAQDDATSALNTVSGFDSRITDTEDSAYGATILANTANSTAETNAQLISDTSNTANTAAFVAGNAQIAATNAMTTAEGFASKINTASDAAAEAKSTAEGFASKINTASDAAAEAKSTADGFSGQISSIENTASNALDVANNASLISSSLAPTINELNRKPDFFYANIATQDVQKPIADQTGLLEFFYFGDVIESNNISTVSNFRAQLNPDRVYEITVKPVFENLGNAINYTIETYLYDENYSDILAQGEITWNDGQVDWTNGSINKDPSSGTLYAIIDTSGLSASQRRINATFRINGIGNYSEGFRIIGEESVFLIQEI